MAHYTANTPEEMTALGKRIGESLQGGEILALRAPLGAGKTVLAKGLAAGIGVDDEVTSPTYTIISEYTGRLPFIHVDLYRISDEDDYEQLALDDLRDRSTVTVIEWPERAGDALPDSTMHLNIAILENGVRQVTLPAELASAAS